MDEQQKAVARSVLEKIRAAEDTLMRLKHQVRDGKWIPALDTLTDAVGSLTLAEVLLNMQVNQEIWRHAQNEPKETTPPS